MARVVPISMVDDSDDSRGGRNRSSGTPRRGRSTSSRRLQAAVPVPVEPANPKYQKRAIPKALREQVWIYHIGHQFSARCMTPWCSNTITVFDYHTSHMIPEIDGGPTDISNLIPLCSKCNLSMGTMTYSEWSRLAVKPAKRRWWICC
jgi:5-methylcytosine-specific restriction endonuclease McrA